MLLNQLSTAQRPIWTKLVWVTWWTSVTCTSTSIITITCPKCSSSKQQSGLERWKKGASQTLQPSLVWLQTNKRLANKEAPLCKVLENNSLP